MVLAGGSRGSLERFYITARLVTSRTDGHYDRAELEQACVQMAERLSLLHEFHAPDFFDKNLFRIFISSLIREKIFNEDSSGKLSYGSAFLKAKKLDKYVLSPAVRRSIRHITSADQ
jgi:glycerol-3-phosphate O-acyltransferase